MALTTQIVENVAIWGRKGAPQTILFADLEDIEEDDVGPFDEAPQVDVMTPRQGRKANVVEDSITATQFQVVQSEIKDVGGTGYYNIRIRGDV